MRLGARVFLDNDAKVAALGEKWLGAGRGVDDLAMITLGTGIGGAIVLNGKIFYVNGGRIALAHEETAMRQINKYGMWTIDELRDLVPSQLMYGLVNPAPPPPDLDLPGRRVAAVT